MKIDQIESGTFSLVRMGRANKFLFYKGGPISNFLAYHRSIWRKLSQQYIDNSRFWPTLTSTPAFSKDITTDVNLIIQMETLWQTERETTLVILNIPKQYYCRSLLFFHKKLLHENSNLFISDTYGNGNLSLIKISTCSCILIFMIENSDGLTNP